MLDQRLKLRHLNCFLETARLGTLSAAAARLNVSQPAASKTLRELEDILKTKLFDRSGRRLTLTHAGTLFQQHAGRALQDLTQAAQMLNCTRPGPAKLAIGVLPTAASWLMPHAAERFRQAHPGCVLRVSTGPNWLLLSQLRDGSLDMVVGRMAAPETMDGLSFRQLYAEEVGAFTRPDHPLQTNPAPVPALAEFPLIVPPRGAVISAMVRAFLLRHGHGDLTPAYESVSLAFGREVVQSSDAIWFISSGVVQHELRSGTLAPLPLGDTVLAGPVGVSMRDEARQTSAHQDLLAALIDTAQDRPKPPAVAAARFF